MTPEGRLWTSVIVALAVVAGGLALEEIVGTASQEPARAPPATSGAWFCPHGGGEGWRAWIVLANPSPEAASVTMRTYGSEDEVSEEAQLEPGRQRLVPVPASPSATGTEVEFFDADVAAGMVIARPGGAGLAAEPCARQTGTRWILSEGTTVRGERTQIVLLNPTATDAVVDVSLVLDDEVVEPGRLEGIVLSPGEVGAIDVGKVALGERTVGAVVTATLGEVVAASIGSSSETIRSVLGVANPARLAVLPGTVDGLEGDVLVTAPNGDVPLGATAVGAEGASKPALQDAVVEGGSAETFSIEGGDVTIVVEASGENGFVAARRLSARTEAAPTSDQAATAGAPGGGRRLIAPSPLSPEGGRSILSLHNPGTEPARVSVTLLLPDGSREPADLRAVDVPAGRTTVVGLTEAASEGSVTALIEVASGEVVAAQTGVSDQGYAVVTGVPWPPALAG